MKHFDLSVITILDPIPRIYSEKIDLLCNFNNVISSYGVVFYFLLQVYPKNIKYVCYLTVQVRLCYRIFIHNRKK